MCTLNHAILKAFVTYAAAWALGNLKDDAAIEPLEALLEDESGYVRAGALNAINSIKS